MANRSNNPLIGICVSEEKRLLRDLVKFRIKKFRRIADATIFRFQIEDFDFNKRKVKGELFEKKSGEWKKDIFPFPDAIFVQSHADRDILKQFESVIGHKVFNNYNFDKWQGFELLAGNPKLREVLPETLPLKSRIDLQGFLGMHKDIFLKPINGHSSRRIVRVTEKKNGSIDVSFLKFKKMRRQSFESFDTFWDWFSVEFFNSDYIIQKSIETIQFGGHSTDIRINMNKDRQGKWTVSALLFRIATNSSHIIPDVSAAFTPDDLTKKFPKKKKKWKKMKKAVVKLGFQICSAIEKAGYHMGNLGIDLGLDENGQLWIFEVNPLPYPFDGSIKDPSMIKPLEYALYLASN